MERRSVFDFASMVTLFAYFIDGRGAGPPPSSSLRLTVVAPSISEELRSMCRVAPLVAFGMLCGGTEDESIPQLPVHEEDEV